MSEPRISVLIATRDRPAALTRCLAALAAQTPAASPFEVIVIDDGGRGALDAVVAPFAQELDVRLVRRATSGGPGAARNTGAEHARGEFIAFTDDDCRPAAEWLEAFRACFARDAGALWGGRVENGLPGDPCAAATQHILEVAYRHQNEDPDDARFFASCNMAMPLAGFRRIGGFDPSFRIASEDRDLCARWHEAGMRLCYAAAAVIRHEHALTLRTFWGQHFRYGRGAWRFHEARRRRGAETYRPDMRRHGRFVASVRTPSLHSNVLMGVWQAANLAGFVWEAATGSIRPRSPNPPYAA